MDDGVPAWKPETSAGMICPFCSGNTGVVDSRPRGANVIRRRRACFTCRRRFTTWEVATEENPVEMATRLQRTATELRHLANLLDRAAETQETAYVGPAAA